MGAQLRVYRQKIKSAQTTKKITKAMELIAASRIQKAQARVAASTPYSRAITRAVSAGASLFPAPPTKKGRGGGAPPPPSRRAFPGGVGGGGSHSNIAHFLTAEPDQIDRAAVVIVTSDRGLAGAFNSQVLREAEQLT